MKRLKPGWLDGKKELYVTSPYGYRIHPIKKKKLFHWGIDISVPTGTKIYAPFAGKLTTMGIRGGAGLYCTLESGGILLRFLHLSSCILGEKAGASTSVSEGQMIAKTGGAKGDRCSGSSTGPHLHFEYKFNGVSVDPQRVLSEKLVGKLNHVFSNGVPVRYNKRTGEEIKPLELKDGKPMDDVNISEAELEESSNRDISLFVDEQATEDLIDEEKDTKEGAAKGIWQIIKLAMDSNVMHLMLYDASISQQTGSLLGFFNKACQQPLVEFSGDTFGDQYYFLVRRPPFDKENMLRALNSQHMFDKSVSKLQQELGKLDRETSYYERPEDDKKKQKEWDKKFGEGSDYYNKQNDIYAEYGDYDNPYLIEDRFILNSNISFNTQDIYSWYQFYPQYELAGDKMQYIVPAILFPEYAAIWGSRPLIVQSQYASFKGLNLKDTEVDKVKQEIIDKRCRTVLDDLKYLIESNAYNPFTRQGTITIIGNRNIHRGMFIQVAIETLVDEIFYVDSVSHSYNITNNAVSDTTTLQVSHGMVKRYIKESQKSLGDISYFDLIEFKDYEKNRNQLNIGNWREVISHWCVNREVLNFFLKKQQFIKGEDY